MSRQAIREPVFPVAWVAAVVATIVIGVVIGVVLVAAGGSRVDSKTHAAECGQLTPLLGRTANDLTAAGQASASGPVDGTALTADYSDLETLYRETSGAFARGVQAVYEPLAQLFVDSRSAANSEPTDVIAIRDAMAAALRSCGIAVPTR